MARQATGTVFERPAGEWRARFRWNGRTKTVHLRRCHTQKEAEHHRDFIADQLKRLRDADQDEFIPKLLELAAAATAAKLDRVRGGVDAIVAGDYSKPGDSPELDDGPTFRDFAESWTSGELHQQHPDHVKVKKTVCDDIYRLQKHIYPVVGSVPLKTFTLEHAEEVLRSLDDGLSAASRRQIAQLMSHVLKLAAYPARHIAQSPIPRGFLPKPSNNKAIQWLYPDEDRLLMKCKKVPLGHRLFYGVLAREGMRKSEAMELRWSDLDLERGTVRLDENKTDDPRTWMLDAGVSLALVLWKMHCEAERGKELPGDEQVFAYGWKSVDDTRAAAQFREHLKQAKVKRAELFAESRSRKPIRLHDLRATFVTLALANDKTEAWVCDRTGHRSSQMVNRYRRSARTAAELNLGALAPLYRAIPELSAKVPESSPPAPNGRKTSPSEVPAAQMKQNATDGNGLDAFRFRWRDPWGFKSLLVHSGPLRGPSCPSRT